MEFEGPWFRRSLLFAGGALSFSGLYGELSSAFEVVVAGVGVLLLFAGLYSVRRAERVGKRKRRRALRDVGGEFDVVDLEDDLPRRDPFDAEG